MSEIVNIKIAKKLKEKGFKEKCLTYYDVIDNVGLLYNTQYTNDLSPCQYTDLLQSHNTDISTYQSDDSEYCVDAPTISQVLKWLRKEKSIICLPHIEPIEEKWFFYVVKLPQASDFPEYLSSVIYNTYEEAALAGIEWVLNNLI